MLARSRLNKTPPTANKRNWTMCLWQLIQSVNLALDTSSMWTPIIDDEVSELKVHPVQIMWECSVFVGTTELSDLMLIDIDLLLGPH